MMGICAANRITIVASILWVRAGTKSMRTVRRSPLSVITQWNGRLVKCTGMATDLMLDRGDPAFQLSDTSRTVPMRPDSSSINGESSRAISPSSCGHQAPFMRPVLRGPRVKRIDGRERSTGV